MKRIKNVLGFSLVLGLALGAAYGTSVYAASVDSISLGTPTNATTGTETTELNVGDIILVPVSIDSTTDTLSSYQFDIKYNNEVLQFGTSEEDTTEDEYEVMDDLNGAWTCGDDEDTVYIIDVFGTTSNRGKFTAYSTVYCNPTQNDDSLAVAWAYGKSASVMSGAELYLVFEVIGELEDLNTAVYEVVDGSFAVSDTANTSNYKPNTYSNNSDITNANACDGAFQISVNTSALPYWVEAVTAKVDGNSYSLDACVTSDGGTTYTLPVRITSATEGDKSAEVTITAKVADGESAESLSNERTVTWGTVTVDMSGTATTYASATGLDTTADNVATE